MSAVLNLLPGMHAFANDITPVQLPNLDLNFSILANAIAAGGGGGAGAVFVSPLQVNDPSGSNLFSVTATPGVNQGVVTIGPGSAGNVGPILNLDGAVNQDVLRIYTASDTTAQSAGIYVQMAGLSNGIFVKGSTAAPGPGQFLFMAEKNDGTPTIAAWADGSGQIGIPPNQLSWSAMGGWTLPANWPGGGGGGGFPPTPPVVVSGLWTFNGQANSTTLIVNPAVATSATQNVVGLLVETGAQTVPNQWPMQIGYTHTAAAGCSNGLLIIAGTNASDSPFTVQTTTGTTIGLIRGDGSGSWGSPVVTAAGTAAAMSWNTAGHVTFTTAAFTSPNQWQWQIGSATAASGSTPGNSNALQVSGGLNGQDYALHVNSDGGALHLAHWAGDGSGFMGNNVGGTLHGISWSGGATPSFNYVGGATGSLGTGGGGGSATLAGLTDVSISGTPTAGQVLTFVAGAPGSWQNQAAASGSLAAGSMTDVILATPAVGQVLRFTAGTPNRWTNQPFTLASLSDMMAGFNPAINQILQYTSAGWSTNSYNINSIGGVSIAAPAVNQVLRWNGTAWANQAIALNSLSDVAGGIPTPVPNGTVLYWSGTGWAQYTGMTFAPGLPTAGDVMTWTTTPTPAWRNQPPTSGGSLTPFVPLDVPATTFNSAQGYWLMQLGGGDSVAPATDHDNGFYMKAGTSANDACIWLQLANGTDVLKVLGDGTVSGLIGGGTGTVTSPIGPFAWGPGNTVGFSSASAAAGAYFRVLNNNVTVNVDLQLNTDRSGWIGPYHFDIAQAASITPLPAAAAGGSALSIQANGVLSLPTSSRLYKTSIRRLTPEIAREILRGLEPVLYRSTCAGDDPNEDHLGLIAEQVAEVCPWLVHYRDGIPESVRYEKLPVLQLAAQAEVCR
jgi:hypothetical protein